MGFNSFEDELNSFLGKSFEKKSSVAKTVRNKSSAIKYVDAYMTNLFGNTNTKSNKGSHVNYMPKPVDTTTNYVTDRFKYINFNDDGSMIIEGRHTILDYCREMGILLNDFNIPVTIKDGLENCIALFSGCTKFNQPIKIPESVTNCTSMFEGCVAFNQPIQIPSNVKSCKSMFSDCKSFNQPIVLPDGLIKCDSMFFRCINFNQPVVIPNSVISCSYMFEGCINQKYKIDMPT